MSRQGVHQQYFGVLVTNIPLVIFGLSLSWSSPYVPLLTSEETPIASGPMSQTDISWMVSGGSLGGLISILISGWLIDKFGRKFTLFLFSVPQLLGWICVHVATDQTWILVGRVFEGLSGSAAFMVVPVFVAEISDDTRRGFFGLFFPIAVNLGTLIGHILPNFLTYRQYPILAEILSVLYIILLFFLVESPAFYHMRGLTAKANESSRYYNRALPENTESDKKEMMPDRWTTIKLIVISLIIQVIPATSGAFLVITFTKSIFDASGSVVSSEISAVVSAFILLLGTAVSSFIIERQGRRILLLFSTFSAGICLLVTGTYFYLRAQGSDTSSYSSVPLIFLSILLFVVAIGGQPVPAVVITEILPQRLRGKVFTACSIEFMVLTSIGGTFFLQMVDGIGMYGFMWIFAVTSFCAGLFTLLVLPETKGKSLEETSRIFAKRRH